MNTKYIKHIILSGVIAFSTTSCLDDLDQVPPNELTSATVYKDFNNYKMVLAKVYAGLALTGQQGPAGNPDITGGDEGFSSYLRQYWQLQELSTDEAIIGWGDAGLPDLHEMDWTPNNQFIGALFSRIYYQISLSNEFIRETSDAKLSERGISGANAETARVYRAEARFLRALSYWHAIDLFGTVPFVTEENAVGAFYPEPKDREFIFDYIESELLAIENELVAAGQNEYGRADQAAAWTLLTKLYLNAEVYTGTPMYTEAITYAKKVIEQGGYTLEPEYSHLFLADNHLSNEIIFPIAFDGLRSQTYGGTTYLVHAPVGTAGNMNPADFGIAGGWAGLRTTENIVRLFSDLTGNTDERAIFQVSGQNREINDITDFSQGYPITKYRNVTSAGAPGSDPAKAFVDVDFPMFRLADVYLMYAEAVVRGGSGGSIDQAVQYINELRMRAFDSNSGNINSSQLTLNFILDERARELNWEAHRRTDLIRFGRFTGANYLWPWKGGVEEGRAVEDYRVLYPLPTADVIANPNLEQNPNYR